MGQFCMLQLLALPIILSHDPCPANRIHDNCYYQVKLLCFKVILLTKAELNTTMGTNATYLSGSSYWVHICLHSIHTDASVS